MEESKQHVQVPTMHLKEESLSFKDPYVYAWLIRSRNHQTGVCNPGLEWLTTHTKLSKPTVLESISRLEKAGYIKVIRTFGNSNHYEFNDTKKFEIYSTDFLDNDDLSINAKSYLIVAQPMMFKNQQTNQGKITYSAEDLTQKMNASLSTIKRAEKELQSKDVLTIVPISKTDGTTGLARAERLYDFEEYFNTIALKFIETDSRLKNLENTKVDKADYDKLLEAVKQQQQTIEELKKELYMQKPLITGNC